MPVATDQENRTSRRRAWLLALAEIAALAAISGWKVRALLSGTVLLTASGQRTNVLLLLTVGGALLALATRGRRVLLLVFSVVLSLLVLVDQVHYRAFRELFSLRELGHAGQLVGVLASVAPYLRWSDAWFFADWPMWFWLACRRAKSVGLAGPQRRIVGAATFAAGFLLCLWASWDYVVSPRPDRVFVTNRPLAVREIGVLGFHLLDLVDVVRSRPPSQVVQAEDLRRVQAWFSGRTRRERVPAMVPFGAARGANLVFLQLESFEAFLIGLVVNGHEITPHLNRLRAESLYGARFFPQSGVGTTSDAEFCALNSLFPALDQVVARRNARNTFRALPALLAEQGYQSMAMSVCRPDLWNMGWMHYQYGFQQRHYYETFRLGQEDPLKISDDRFFERAREILRAGREPFFAHLMTISSHAPFHYLPATWQRLDLGPWQQGILGDYLQAAHFADDAVGRFLDGLRSDGLLDRTVLIIYGDHEALPSDERRKVRPLETDAIGSRLDERLRPRVPLLIRIPGYLKGTTMDLPAGQIDLAPSVLHVLGVPGTNAFHLGRNLFADTNALVSFRSGAFLNEQIFFNPPDRQLNTGACEPIVSGAKVDEAACEAGWHETQERLRISDLILEQNMIPALGER